MTNPYRAMCSHPLAQKAYVAFVQICKGGSDDAGTYDADEAIVRRALKRLDELEGTLLAEPEAEGPSDEELLDLADDLDLDRFEGERYDYSGTVIKEGCWELDFARAALARWGRPTPQPVPLSERLPGPEDCNAEEMCWWLIEPYPRPVGPGGKLWSLCRYYPGAAHWLPAHALPLPQVAELEAQS